MTSTIHKSIAVTKEQVVSIYQELLKCWNDRNAREYAALFTDEGIIIGFDGSQATGRKEIYDHLKNVFEDHRTGTYISIVREIRFLSEDVALLRANAGMVTFGQHDINPSVNTIQTLIVKQERNDVKIVLFQNTPAAFHNRPELKEEFTNELKLLLRKQAGPEKF